MRINIFRFVGGLILSWNAFWLARPPHLVILDSILVMFSVFWIFIFSVEDD